jgi:hypothetical protein
MTGGLRLRAAGLVLVAALACLALSSHLAHVASDRAGELLVIHGYAPPMMGAAPPCTLPGCSSVPVAPPPCTVPGCSSVPGGNAAYTVTQTTESVDDGEDVTAAQLRTEIRKLKADILDQYAPTFPPPRTYLYSLLSSSSWPLFHTLSGRVGHALSLYSLSTASTMPETRPRPSEPSLSNSVPIHIPSWVN